MAEPTPARLRALAAEIRHELPRHRFRNLYLFELDAALLDGLLGATPVVWEETRAALASFASTLEALAEGREA